MVAAFQEKLKSVNPTYLKFDTLQTIQANLGNVCNLCCSHCHVGASPSGTHVMPRRVMDKIMGFLRRQPGITLDMTGGCPEMNPHFRYLVEHTEGLAARRIIRSNLTIISEPGMEWLPDFYRRHQLVIAASLPCYLRENVEQQRGSGVYERSIAALRCLNAVGYGSDLELNLVYNPGDAFIAGSQKELEETYRTELFNRYGIRFNDLYTMTNAPIGRFREYLESRDTYERYLNLLASSFNPDVAGNIMCRSLVSVDWNGFLYNCDFNLAMGLPITGDDGTILKIDDLESAALAGSDLLLAQHCYCCTAGEGSSCTGSLVA